MPEFTAAYREITLDLALSDRRVDVVAEGFDLAIRVARLEDSSLLARKLCDVRLLLVGAPDYLDRCGRPTQLAEHRLMAYSGSVAPRVWRFSHPIFGETMVEPTAYLWTDNADLLTPLLVAGQGLALQPEFLVWRELREGVVEHAMADWASPVLGLHLVTPPSPLRPLRVRVMIEHLAKSLTRPPWAG